MVLQRDDPTLDALLGALPAPRVPLHLRERVVRAACAPSRELEESEPPVGLPRGSLWMPLLVMTSLCVFVLALVGSISGGYRHVRPGSAHAALAGHRIVRLAPMGERPLAVLALAPSSAMLTPVPVLVGPRTRAELTRTLLAFSPEKGAMPARRFGPTGANCAHTACR